MRKMPNTRLRSPPVSRRLSVFEISSGAAMASDIGSS